MRPSAIGNLDAVAGLYESVSAWGLRCQGARSPSGS
jgi:hypothetical protein